MQLGVGPWPPIGAVDTLVLPGPHGSIAVRRLTPQKLAAAGNDLTYMHNPDLTHGFPQFTRWSSACHQATLDLADLMKSKIG